MFRNKWGAQERTDGYAEVMLTSCIDLFMSIISFLLMCAAFFQIRVINASVPTISDAPIEAGQSEKELNVILTMDKNGFTVAGNGDGLTAAEVASVRGEIPKVDGKFDLEKLTAALTGIKWRFPRGKSVVMVPDSDISYEEIVVSMDAARWGKPKDASGSKDSRPLLYPNVVLSSLIQEDK
jgi:biopolymer transport protein ExbD